MVDKKALLEEFNNVIAPQKSALSTRLPQLFQQYYAPPAELPSVAAGGQTAINGATPGTLGKASGAAKRGASDQPQHGNKRLKQQAAGHDDLERRAETLFKEVNNLINKKLWQKKECIPFKEPVDIVKLKIPDYFNYIKHPMDLGTVKAKLERKEYKTPLEACEDVRLVWRNCATYNQSATPVRKSGDMLSDIWERAWMESRIEERWYELMLLKDPAGSAVPYKVAQLTHQLKSAMNQIPAAAAAAPADGATTVSELDKRRLSIQVSDLQGEQLAALLELLQEDLPISSADDEVELDFDTLPVATLLKMQAFVSKISSAPVNQAPVKQEGPAAAAAPANDNHAEPGQAQESQQEDEVMVPASSGQTSPGVTADSQGEVKGSTADDPHAKDTPFVWSNKAGVAESATAPNATSSILRDRAAGARKPDVHVDAANWDVSALQQGEQEQEAEEDDAEDDTWVNFKTREEQRRQQVEEQRKLKEQQEEELRKKKDAAEEEARRAASEAEERERALQEEEARAQQEQQRARMEQCDKEVDEIKARQGTANLVQRDDMQGLIVQAQPTDGDLAAVGLTYKNDDDDVNFDDE